MSIQDKVAGRLKQAAGDLAGDKELRNEGVREERKAEAKRELREAEQRVERLRGEIARLEYGSSREGASLQAARDETIPSGQQADGQTGAQRSGDPASDRPHGEGR
jgi:uncharacterized protein YjbJ (UPF0337 family)